MKNTLLSFLAMAVLGISTAHASILGEWNGWGEWKFDGSGMACHMIQFKFNENAKQLFRAVGNFSCDQVNMQAPPLTLQKVGKNLVLDQKIVGDFTESRYHWIEPYSSTVNIEILIERSANHLDYQEHWINLKGELIYDINARLFLHQ
jgi:hypothetical protein